MPELHHVVIPRLKTVHIKVGDNPNYPASCSVFLYGDVGLMYSINGKLFYEYFGKAGKLRALCDELGVCTLEGYVTFAHARAMRMLLRRSATVTRVKDGTMSGQSMTWVAVRPLEVHSSSDQETTNVPSVQEQASAVQEGRVSDVRTGPTISTEAHS